jgi:hypothetical protein
MRTFVIRFGLFMFLAGILSTGGSTPALALRPSQAVTPDEFWQLVDDTIGALRGLKSQPDAIVTKKLDDLVYSWSRIEGVTLSPNGKFVPLDTLYIAGKLNNRPYNLDALISFFTDLRNSQNISPSRNFGAADLNALQSILERPEFQWNRPPSPLEEWWNQLKAKILQWLDSLFGKDGVSVPVPGDLFTILAVIILVLILLYIFRKLFGDFIAEASMDQEQMAGDELLTAETALQKAKEISRAGDYRTAVRYLYLSSLLTLDERGLLRFDRSKTNREYLRTVAALPQLSAPLHDVIDVFDRVWYGFQPLDEDSFQHYVEKVDQLREQKK